MRSKAASCLRKALAAGELAFGKRMVASVSWAASSSGQGFLASSGGTSSGRMLFVSGPAPCCPRACGFATAAAPGADLAQQILAASDPADLSDVAPLLQGLPPSGLPAVARATAVSGVTDRAFVSALVDAAILGLPSLPAADLCAVMESLSDLRAYSVAFKDAAADLVLARLDDFTGDQLGHTLRAFGAMQYYDDDLLEGVVAHVAAHPDKFSAENVADIVYAFSKCGFCHPDLVSVVERAAGVLLAEATHDRGEAIANIVDAYSRVGCSEPDVVDTLLTRAAASAPDLSASALGKLVVATIRLGFEDERLLGPLLDAAVARAQELSPKAIVKMVAALGELGLSHRPLLDAITDKVVPSRLSEFHAAGLSDLVCALNKVGYYNSAFMQLMQAQRVMPRKVSNGGGGGGSAAYPGAVQPMAA